MAHDRAGFTSDDFLACYRRGVFPMADSRRDARIYLVEPAQRGVIPLEAFHTPARLARTVRQNRFEISADQAFEAVVEACAAPAAGRPETWISRPLQGLYGELHARGFAHSLEAWRDGRLTGGLFGVAIGGAFFGESMFQAERDASKVALVHLVARLRFGGFLLLDAQFQTLHLERFGAIEIPRAAYLQRLASATAESADFARWPAQAAGMEALQAISQAS